MGAVKAVQNLVDFRSTAVAGSRDDDDLTGDLSPSAQANSAYMLPTLEWGRAFDRQHLRANHFSCTGMTCHYPRGTNPHISAVKPGYHTDDDDDDDYDKERPEMVTVVDWLER